MIIKDLKTLKELFKGIKTPIFGVGVYAFDRLGLENIVSNYRILTLRYSLDTELIEKDIEILSLEKGMGTKHIKEPRNATTLIVRSEKIKKYLEKFQNPAIYIYKPSTKMERACEQNNWKLLSNPTEFGKKLLENKINFRRMLEDIDVAVPPGKISSLEKLHYGHLINKYGIPFVIQHPTKGGGKGTFLIDGQESFQETIDKLNRTVDDDNEDNEKRKIIPPTEVIVAKFIQGPSPSITACVTKDGILSTNLQHQILDIPQLYNPEKGFGLFCGHDWTSSNFDKETSEQAYEYVQKIGNHFKEIGYKGIFGLDFVLSKKTKKLYVIECNPRMLGSYPTVNMAQLLNNEPPLLAFHVLEFINADYQVDIEEVNKIIRQKKIGSQMILHNLSGHWAKNKRELKAGIYKLENNKLKYLREGYDLKHLKDKEEFLLADGVPFKKSHFSPNRRLCRILTLNSVLDSSNYRILNPWAKQVAEVVYKAFVIKPVKLIKAKKFISPNFLAKG
ncbi:MAG: ATP-grasp domain-containing protein [Patescibacteria group bacterium]|nr:ATP-grasp domain-containing protein [Patescibacteria group bacterium]